MRADIDHDELLDQRHEELAAGWSLRTTSTSCARALAHVMDRSQEVAADALAHLAGRPARRSCSGARASSSYRRRRTARARCSALASSLIPARSRTTRGRRSVPPTRVGRARHEPAGTSRVVSRSVPDVELGRTHQVLETAGLEVQIQLAFQAVELPADAAATEPGGAQAQGCRSPRRRCGFQAA